jgi:hypothetical protein
MASILHREGLDAWVRVPDPHLGEAASFDFFELQVQGAPLVPLYPGGFASPRSLDLPAAGSSTPLALGFRGSSLGYMF